MHTEGQSSQSAGPVAGVPPRVKVSAVLNTLNAEATLDLALRSLTSWVDEVIVVDMNSDDATQQIALQHGARLVLHDRIGSVDPARDSSVALAVHEWAFVLDADEVVPASLVPGLLDIAARDAADVVVIPWANYVFGRRMSHGTFGPTVDAHARFFKRGSILSNGGVHSWPEPRPEARVARLPAIEALSVLHFAYADVSDFVQRADRYTTLEAERFLAGGNLGSSELLGAGRQFVHGFLVHRGFRDGRRGWDVALLLLFYRLLVAVKKRQLKDVGNREAVAGYYRSMALSAIAGETPFA